MEERTCCLPFDAGRWDGKTHRWNEERLRQASPTVLLSMSFLLLWVGGVRAADVPTWPQFRGPNSSGVAGLEANPPTEFGPTRNVVWKTVLPSGHSSPCIWGDHLFLTGFDAADQKLKVLCLDRATGNIRWSRDVPAEQIEKVHSVSSPATATPATDGEQVYAYFGSCGLLCYSLAGEFRWSCPLPVPKVQFGSGASPIVWGDLVALNRDEQDRYHIIVVNRRDGKIKWEQSQPSTSEFGANSYATPVVWQGQLVFHRMGEVVACAAEDGTRVWSVTAATKGESTPVVGSDMLFVAAWTDLGEAKLRVKLPDYATLLKAHDGDKDGKISRSEFPADLAAAQRPEVSAPDGPTIFLKRFWSILDKDRNGLIDEAEWQQATDLVSSLSRDHGLTAIQPGGKGDITPTHVLWQEKTDVSEVPSPLYDDGRVYMVANGGVVTCVNAKSGSLVYRQRIGATGSYYASPVAARNRIYMISSKGVVTVMTAGAKADILAQTDLGEPVFATPAIVETRLYVRTAKNMYAFGE
jgi:outer membrane protein assembly factor BamB